MKTETLDSIRLEIHGVISRFNKRIPAQAINTLFVAIPHDESTLTQEILGYLLENNYEALETPTGQSLRERLTSTDWSLKEKEEVVEPKPIVAPAPAASAPAPTVPAAAPSATIKLSRSDSVLVALVLTLVVILSWLWQHKMSEMAEETITEEPASVIATTPDSPGSMEKPSAKNSPSVRPKVQPSPSNSAEVASPQPSVLGATLPENAATPAETPEKAVVATAVVATYDEVDDRIGEFGLRAARKGTKWGYVSSNDDWQIEPVYDDVTPFKNGKAAVILDGQSIVIDRNGSRIRLDE